MEGKDHQIRERWSEQIIRGGFTAVPMNFLRRYSRLGLNATDAMLLIHIMAYRWDRHLPFPSLTRIAEEMGLSTSQVRFRMARLEKDGYIERVYRKGRSTLYNPSGLIQKLEKDLETAEVPVNDVEIYEREM
jgi:biotin operon repressor